MTILDFFKTVHPSVLAAKMIFKYLQEHHPILRISDIADTTSGGTPNRGMVDYYNGDIPWIKSGELKDGLITNCDEYITEAGLKNSSAKLFPKGTLLVAMYGANIGKTGVLNFEASTNQAVCAIFPKVNISSDFLFWYFKQQRIDFIAIGKGGAQPNISQTVINNASIVVPDEKIQQKIVEFLYAIEQGKGIDKDFFIPDVIPDIERIYKYKNNYIALTESFETQLTQIENLNQAILQEAVQGKLVPQDPTDEPASELLKRIKAEKEKLGKKEKTLPSIKPEEIPFEIPESWVWCRLSEIVRITGGGTPSMMNSAYWNGDITWVSPKDMKSEFIYDSEMKITEKAIRETTANLIPQGSILIVGRSGILKRKVPVAINKIDCAVNQDMKVYIPTLFEMNRYIQFMFLGMEEIILKRFVKFGMTVHSLKYEEFANMPIPLPPVSEQKPIVVEIEKQLAKTKQLKEHILSNQQATEQLLKALLHEAFAVEETKVESEITDSKIIEFKPTNVDYYKRSVLAAEIVWQLHKEPTLGHLKVQKLIYLCQQTAEMQLPTNFLRQAMGPYDPKLMRSIDKQLNLKKWFQFKQGELLKYKPLEKAGEHHKDYIRYFSAESQNIQFLIDTFKTIKSNIVEIVATLYACLDKMQYEKLIFSEPLLIQRFYEWSEEKKKFSEKEISRVFSRMKETGIIPKGYKL